MKKKIVLLIISMIVFGNLNAQFFYLDKFLNGIESLNHDNTLNYYYYGWDRSFIRFDSIASSNINLNHYQSKEYFLIDVKKKPQDESIFLIYVDLDAITNENVDLTIIGGSAKKKSYLTYGAISQDFEFKIRLKYNIENCEWVFDKYLQTGEKFD